MTYYEFEPQPLHAEPHSGFGIASFITSVVANLVLTVVVLVAGIVDAATPGGLDEDSLTAGLLGLLMLAMLGALLVSLVLGIVGLVQKSRRNLFAILGISISAIGLAGGVVLLIAGLALGG